MSSSGCVVPPGFRFHPTEEELVGYYLAKKVASQSHNKNKIDEEDMDIIQEVDLCRIEPWDLLLQTNQEQKEWYFFSHKDRKYPSGTRTNRATAAGFWKATGRDKPVMSGNKQVVIGMRKTLVFYKGRAPNGRKTDWIMHEYRLQSHSHSHSHQEEAAGWVVCRAFQKQMTMTPPYPSSRPSIGYHYFSGSTSTSALLYPESNNDDDDFVESKTKPQQHLWSSIPQLIDNGYQQQHRLPLLRDGDLIQHGGGGEPGPQAAIDWNFLDTLLLSSTTQDPLHPLNC